MGSGIAAWLWGQWPRRKLAAIVSETGTFADHTLAKRQQSSDAEHAVAVRFDEVGSVGTRHPARHEKLAAIGRLCHERGRGSLVQGRDQQTVAEKRVKAVADREICGYWYCV